MNCKLLGVDYLDYISKKTNNRVLGCIIYVGEFIEKNGAGYRCSKFFISSKHPAYSLIVDVLSIGTSEIEIYFDRHGNISNIVEA